MEEARQTVCMQANGADATPTKQTRLAACGPHPSPFICTPRACLTDTAPSPPQGACIFALHPPCHPPEVAGRERGMASPLASQPGRGLAQPLPLPAPRRLLPFLPLAPPPRPLPRSPCPVAHLLRHCLVVLAGGPAGLRHAQAVQVAVSQRHAGRRVAAHGTKVVVHKALSLARLQTQHNHQHEQHRHQQREGRKDRLVFHGRRHPAPSARTQCPACLADKAHKQERTHRPRRRCGWVARGVGGEGGVHVPAPLHIATHRPFGHAPNPAQPAHPTSTHPIPPRQTPRCR